MASTAPSYRPRGGSLVIAVVFRFLWLPLFSGGALALATGAREVGIVAGCALLGVELATYRWRWAWRTLDTLPADAVPVESPADVYRQAWGYGVGIALLGVGLAVWQAYVPATPGQAARLAGIVVGTALAVCGYVGFEYLVRRPRGRSRLGMDDVIDVPADWPALLVLLAPASLRRGAATLVMIGTMSLCAALGMTFAAEVFTAIGTMPPLMWLCLPVVLALGSVGALAMSTIEAHHATAFVGIHGSAVESPPAA